MMERIVWSSVMPIIGICAPVWSSQIQYIDQSRQVNSFYAGQPGHPLCSQSQAAPNFGPFNQMVSCTALGTPIFASQTSSLGLSTIDFQCESRAPNSAGFADTSLLVRFTLNQESHYTLSGQVASPKSETQVRLTGPSGDLHHPTGTMEFNYCGTLGPGQYELYANSFQSQGGIGIGASSANFTLRIVTLGDVNADQSVNIDDLVSTITAWGNCPSRGACPQDFNCDGTVNIDDLVTVITHWN